MAVEIICVLCTSRHMMQRPMRPAHLVLEDGSVFAGRAVGAPGAAAGEACFTTAMAGYEEAVTDPSYAAQVLTFTYPLVGNYGVDPARMESDRVHTRGVVVRRARPAFAEWLAGEGVVALEEVDTRALVRRVREDGAMRCALGEAPLQALLALARSAPHIYVPRHESGESETPNLAFGVMAKEPFTVGAGPRLVVLDYGCKGPIVWRPAGAGA